MEISPIAEYRCSLPEKFGIPRQSGLVPELTGEIVFFPEFSRHEAVRGLEQFSHLWLIWEFHAADRPAGKAWSSTVRPPRLGGNKRVGVFATRSPFRPNPLGLSCVKLVEVFADEHPVRLTVAGADLLNGTPIFDIKPYLPFADSIPEASAGFTAQTQEHRLRVDFPPHLLVLLPEDCRDAAAALLAQDPRPGYADDPERIYGMQFAGFDIRFRAADGTASVCSVVKLNTN